MNRTMILMASVLIGCIPGVLATPAWCTTITMDSIAATSSSNDLTAAGVTDWALPGQSEKAGGDVIVTADGVNGHLAATFQTYSDGTQPYWQPVQDRPGAVVYSTYFGSAHMGGCNFVLCDGSVRTISYSIDGEIHRRLCNREDGQTVDASAY